MSLYAPLPESARNFWQKSHSNYRLPASAARLDVPKSFSASAVHNFDRSKSDYAGAHDTALHAE